LHVSVCDLDTDLGHVMIHVCAIVQARVLLALAGGVYLPGSDLGQVAHKLATACSALRLNLKVTPHGLYPRATWAAVHLGSWAVFSCSGVGCFGAPLICITIAAWLSVYGDGVRPN
jgi:hypothetical protein